MLRWKVTLQEQSQRDLMGKKMRRRRREKEEEEMPAKEGVDWEGRMDLGEAKKRRGTESKCHLMKFFKD